MTHVMLRMWVPKSKSCVTSAINLNTGFIKPYVIHFWIRMSYETSTLSWMRKMEKFSTITVETVTKINRIHWLCATKGLVGNTYRFSRLVNCWFTFLFLLIIRLLWRNNFRNRNHQPYQADKILATCVITIRLVF